MWPIIDKFGGLMGCTLEIILCAFFHGAAEVPRRRTYDREKSRDGLQP